MYSRQYLLFGLFWGHLFKQIKAFMITISWWWGGWLCEMRPEVILATCKIFYCQCLNDDLHPNDWKLKLDQSRPVFLNHKWFDLEKYFFSKPNQEIYVYLWILLKVVHGNYVEITSTRFFGVQKIYVYLYYMYSFSYIDCKNYRCARVVPCGVRALNINKTAHFCSVYN